MANQYQSDYSHIHPEFRSITRAVLSEMQDELREHEDYRATLEARRNSWGLTFRKSIPAFIAVAIFGIYAFRAEEFRYSPYEGYFIVFVAAVVAIFTMFDFKRDGKAAYEATNYEIDQTVLARLVPKLGLNFAKQSDMVEEIDPFREMEIVPHAWRTISLTNIIAGERADNWFAVFDCEMKNEVKVNNERRLETFYKGKLFRIPIGQRFSGQTLIKQDFGLLNFLHSISLNLHLDRPEGFYQRARFASPTFEKMFQVWSTDPSEARYLLDPVVMECFIELRRINAKHSVQAAFKDGHLLLAFKQNHRRFSYRTVEIGSPEYIEELLGNIAAIYEVIDLFEKPLKD